MMRPFPENCIFIPELEPAAKPMRLAKPAPHTVNHLKKTVMASRRKLKKNVNYIAGELLAACLVKSMPETADKKKADGILTLILVMQNEFVNRLSHTEPGNVKGFYKKFHSDLNAKLNEIIDAITALN
jgi:hypothetical protein